MGCGGRCLIIAMAKGEGRTAMRTQSQFNNYKRLVNEAIKYTFISSMEFEEGMRQILGHKAYHTADWAGSPPAAKRLLLQATRKLSARVGEIITMDSRLRERLLSDLSSLQMQIRGMNKTPCRIHMIGLLFEIIGRLLGYDWMDGNVYRTPIYFRTKSQEYRDHIKHMRHWREWEKEENELVLQRRRICLQLNEQGMHQNQIARVLNISEYEVTQLIKDHHLAEIAKLLEEGRSLEEATSQFREGGSQRFWALWKRREAARKRRSMESS